MNVHLTRPGLGLGPLRTLPRAAAGGDTGVVANGTTGVVASGATGPGVQATNSRGNAVQAQANSFPLENR